jgi:hypothetical protein
MGDRNAPNSGSGARDFPLKLAISTADLIETLAFEAGVKPEEIVRRAVRAYQLLAQHIEVDKGAVILRFPDRRRDKFMVLK